MKKPIPFLVGFCLLLQSKIAFAQPCMTPQGDQVSYGTNNTWIGYVYDNSSFGNYMGYVLEGSATDPSFGQTFGGMYVNYPTNGCSVYTEDFSIRYKLSKTFTAGTYEFNIAGDDRVRLSIDGGVSWLIDNWVYNGYEPGTATVTLNGTYNMIVEYSEGAHNNNVFFQVVESCAGTGNTSIYGTNNIWNGYIYAGINFNRYKGMVNEGNPGSMNFNQSYGGSSVQYLTDQCPVLTDFFSARYRLQRNFISNSYTFTVTADDKYRLSLDGGATWVIDRWNFNNGNSTRIYTTNLSGNHDLVLEYYEKDGSNALGFSYVSNIVLPFNLLSFTGRKTSSGILLNWKLGGEKEPVSFDIEKSEDGTIYQKIGVLSGTIGDDITYSYTDNTNAFAGMLYYRLKITDSQGRISYSKIISLLNEGKGNRIYPTLVTSGTVYLSNEQGLPGAIVTISDMTGRPVVNKPLGNLAAGQTTSLFLSDLKLLKGIYLFQLSSKGSMIKAERIVVQ